MDTVTRTHNTATGWAPFRVCVLADIEPGPDYALRGPSPLFCRRITSLNFDRMVEMVSPSFRLITQDPLGGPELELDIRFEESKDFGISALLKSSPIRTFVDALEACALPTDQLKDLLGRVFGDRAANLLKLLPLSAQSNLRPSAGVGATSRVLPHHEILDGLLGLVDLPTEDRPTLDTKRKKCDVESVDIQRELQRSLTAVLNALLADSEFRRLTRTWRSLRALCDSVKNCEWLELYVLAGLGTPEECRTKLEQLSPDLIILESPVSACARDAERLSALSDWAARQCIPVVATLADDFTSDKIPCHNAGAPSRAKLSGAATRLLNALSARDSSRWLVLCLNDVCAAGPNTERYSGLRKAEYSPPSDSLLSFTFLPAGIAVAICCIRSLLENGHPYPIAESGEAQIRSREVRIVVDNDREVAIGTKHLANVDDALELGKLGICCLVPVHNRDLVLPQVFPTAYRPKTNSGDLGRPESTLGDQLLASRLARLIREFASALDTNNPSTVTASALEIQIEALFPDAPPVGPEVKVTSKDAFLEVQVMPHRYGGLQVEILQAAWRLVG